MIELVAKEDRKFVHDIIKKAVFEDLEKFKFFINSSKGMDFKESVRFQKEEFISCVEGKIQGYFAYLHDRANEKIINIEVMAIEETPVLVRDFLIFCKLLVSTYDNFELSIIPQSPAYHIAQKCFEKFKFKRVGVLKSSIKLLDNKRYDLEIWEKKGE